MIEFLISFFIGVGAIFMILGSISILRLPDVYCRINAATKSATFGVSSTMLGVFLYFLFIEGVFSAKILLTILFVFLTAPIVGFMVSRSAYRLGVNIFRAEELEQEFKD